MPADPNENFTVSSRVVGPTNRGIAGSSVEMYAITDQKELPYTIKRLMVETTDAEGGFEFQIPMEYSNPRKLFVVVQAEGYSIGWEQLSRIIEENTAVGLSRQQGTLEGTVSNQVGHPISNATVRVVIGHSYHDADELIFAMASTPMMTTTTGPDGRFSIPNLPLSARAEVVVTADAYPKTCSWRTDQGLEQPTMAPGQPGIQILLSRETGVYGQLVDAVTKKPIPNEKVYLIHRQEGRTMPVLAWSYAEGTVLWKTMGGDNRECVTTPTGLFVATGLPAGEYHVGLDPFTHPNRKWIALNQAVRVDEGKVVRIEVQAIRPAIVKLYCEDREQSKAVRGIQFRIVSTSESETSVPSYSKTFSSITFRSVDSETVTLLKTALSFDQSIQDPTTDEQGMATLTLVPGRYRIESVTREGYKLDGAPIEFETRSGEEQTLKIPVVFESNKVGIWGTCMDESGKPLAGVRLRILNKPEIACVSDSTGYFQFQIPRPEDRFRYEQSVLFADHPETGTCVVRMRADSIQKDHTIVLKPNRVLTGQVLDPSGLGIQKATLVMYLCLRPNLSFLYNLTDPAGYLPISTDYTDSTGAFRISSLDPDQTYVLRIQHPGYGYYNYTVRSQQWMVTSAAVSNPGGTDNPIRVKPSTLLNLDVGPLTLSPSNLYLSGIVVNLRGKPVANIRLDLSGNEQVPELLAVSDPNGLFRFDNLAPGKVLLSFPGKAPYERFQEEFVAGSHDLRIVLTGQPPAPEMEAEEKDLANTALVRLRVIDNPTSESMCCISVDVHQPDKSVFSVRCDEQGLATFHIGKGHYKIFCGSVPDYSTTRLDIDSEIGKVYSLELRLYLRVTISGIVLSADGKPAAKASVRVVNGMMLDDSIGWTDQNGRFKFQYDVIPVAEGFTPYVEAVSDYYRFSAAASLPQTEEPITIQLQPTTTLIVRTLNAAGKGMNTIIDKIYMDGKPWYPCVGQKSPLRYESSDTHTILGLVLPAGRHLAVEVRDIRLKSTFGLFDIPDALIVPGETSNLDITIKAP